MNKVLNYITSKAINIYFVALLLVTLLFVTSAMKWYWFLIGIISVVGFFYYTPRFMRRWSKYSPKLFQKKLFSTAFTFRIIYVILSYLFYLLMTGKAFEFGAADSWIYHLCGSGLSNALLDGNFRIQEVIDRVMGSKVGVSDTGYITYLGFVYALSFKSILVVRFLKALLSAWTCVLIYKLAQRNFGDNVARLSAIFCMLMPNLIYYCGMHLKETEMVFLIVLFIERADLMLRGSKIDLKLLFTVLIVGLSLFTFRTVLGAVAFLSLFTALVFSSRRIVGYGKKFILGGIVVVLLGVAVSDNIRREVEDVMDARGTNQSTSMEWRAERKDGNSFAKYASSTVFAPLIFTIPFPTMVEIPNQENQLMIHGGNYVKNIISFFTILALFLLLISGKWRNNVLPIAVMCGYLIVVAFSAFAHSERFHLPALPFALMFAAYGISQFNRKHKKWYPIWLAFIFVAIVGWSWIKLAGRGLV